MALDALDQHFRLSALALEPAFHYIYLLLLCIGLFALQSVQFFFQSDEVESLSKRRTWSHFICSELITFLTPKESLDLEPLLQMILLLFKDLFFSDVIQNVRDTLE